MLWKIQVWETPCDLEGFVSKFLGSLKYATPRRAQIASIEARASCFGELSITTSLVPVGNACQALVSTSMIQGVLNAMVKQ